MAATREIAPGIIEIDTLLGGWADSGIIIEIASAAAA